MIADTQAIKRLTTLASGVARFNWKIGTTYRIICRKYVKDFVRDKDGNIVIDKDTNTPCLEIKNELPKDYLRKLFIKEEMGKSGGYPLTEVKHDGRGNAITVPVMESKQDKDGKMVEVQKQVERTEENLGKIFDSSLERDLVERYADKLYIFAFANVVRSITVAPENLSTATKKSFSRFRSITDDGENIEWLDNLCLLNNVIIGSMKTEIDQNGNINEMQKQELKKNIGNKRCIGNNSVRIVMPFIYCEVNPNTLRPHESSEINYSETFYEVSNMFYSNSVCKLTTSSDADCHLNYFEFNLGFPEVNSTGNSDLDKGQSSLNKTVTAVTLKDCISKYIPDFDSKYREMITKVTLQDLAAMEGRIRSFNYPTKETVFPIIREYFRENYHYLPQQYVQLYGDLLDELLNNEETVNESRHLTNNGSMSSNVIHSNFQPNGDNGMPLPRYVYKENADKAN